METSWREEAPAPNSNSKGTETPPSPPAGPSPACTFSRAIGPGPPLVSGPHGDPLLLLERDLRPSELRARSLLQPRAALLLPTACRPRPELCAAPSVPSAGPRLCPVLSARDAVAGIRTVPVRSKMSSMERRKSLLLCELVRPAAGKALVPGPEFQNRGQCLALSGRGPLPLCPLTRLPSW